MVFAAAEFSLNRPAPRGIISIEVCLVYCAEKSCGNGKFLLLDRETGGALISQDRNATLPSHAEKLTSRNPHFALYRIEARKMTIDAISASTRTLCSASHFL